MSEAPKKNPRGTRFGDLYDALENTVPPRVVPVLGSLSDADFRSRYAQKSHPFVLKIGETRGEEALQSILREFGNRVIKVRFGDYADPYHYAPERRQLKEMRILDYICMLNELAVSSPGSLPPPYAGNFTVPIQFLEELGVGNPKFYDRESFEAPTIWLGAKGSYTPLHRDSSDNFATQLMGRKKWTIFPPQDAPLLYMNFVSASAGGDFATSDIDLRSPDLSKFPLLSAANAIEFILKAGEMLYLPMGWSHCVENLEPSLMINYWRSVKPSGIGALE